MVMLTLTKDDTISGLSEKAWNYKHSYTPYTLQACLAPASMLHLGI